MRGFHQSEHSKPVSIYLNSFPQNTKRLEIYESKNVLLVDLEKDITDSIRVFFTSNSKNQVDQLYAKIKDLHPDKKFLRVTSDNSSSNEVQEILLNAKTALCEFDAVFTSPSLSTGIDLTFDNDEIVFQRVYGLFQAKINTHFDIDQQLSRVRHTETTRVWVTREVFSFETELQVCSIDLMREHLLANTFSGVHAIDLEVLESEADSFIRMGSLVLSGQRASKNRLYENFIEHKTEHGVEIAFVEKDSDKSKAGAVIAKEGKRLARAEAIKQILQSGVLSQRQFIEVSESLKQSKALSEAKVHSYSRHRIEFFNRATEIDAAMIDRYLDRYHQEVVMLEEVLLLGIDCDCLQGAEKLLCEQRQQKVEELIGGKSSRSHSSSKVQSQVQSRIQARIDKPKELLANALLEVFCESGLYVMKEYRLDDDTLVSGYYPDFDVELSIDDLAGFVSMVKHLSWVFDCFDIVVRKDMEEKPIRYLSQCLRMTGLELVKSRVSQVDNRKVYFYRLDSVKTKAILDLIGKRRSLKTDLFIEQYWQAVHAKHGIEETIFSMVSDSTRSGHEQVLWVPVAEDVESKFLSRRKSRSR